ncbi:MAG TPA: TylF/MycF/NovP-related O-methyltransferase, partial [Nevskia sp.]|nr:TylF/MycF/NovP-related O-methyltransferase [Nevskia sp.]
MTFRYSELLQKLRPRRLHAAVRRRLGLLPAAEQARWYGTSNPQQAVQALTEWARAAMARSTSASADAWVLSLGDGDPLHQSLNQSLRQAGVRFRDAGLVQLQRWGEAECRGGIMVLCAYADARRLTAAARILAQHACLGGVPMEYVGGLDAERALFARRDEYRDTFFVSPVLLDQPTPYEIYEESLQRFEQKCGLRDYLDLYQLLRHVVDNRIPGDIAEFGSYRGHSGWLIARTLRALGDSRRVFMFDMFESFPEEGLGVDHFWNQSHDVQFEEVRARLAEFDNVSLVRGDFTRTLVQSEAKRLALAYIDCDSYRATRYLLDTLLGEPGGVELSGGGVLACEDYGHPALLGNRAAV